MSDRKIVHYYFENPQKIEKSMASVFEMFPVGKGGIDLVMRDVNQNICLVEVARSSHWSDKQVAAKLYRYNEHLRLVGIRMFHLHPDNFKIRLLIFRPPSRLVQLPIQQEPPAMS